MTVVIRQRCLRDRESWFILYTCENLINWSNNHIKGQNGSIMNRPRNTDNIIYKPPTSELEELAHQAQDCIWGLWKTRRKMSVVIVALIALSGTLACNIPFLSSGQISPLEGEEKPELDVSPPDHTQPTLLQLGDAVLDGVVSTSEGETEGRILTVQITNPGNQEVLVTIPCGLIFKPEPGSDEQQLMVIQQASATIPPGESADLTPYVICIESSKAVPESDSTYQVGVMATGDLLKIAQCICNETLVDIETDPIAAMDQLGLQFSVWMVSDGLSMDEMIEGMEEAEGALGQIGATGLPEGMEDIVGGLMEMFQDFGQDWLEKCDIEINP